MVQELDENNTSKKVHRAPQAGRKADKKKAKKERAQDQANKQKNPKAFAIKNAVRAERQFRRKQDLETKKTHIPVVDRNPIEPPPVVVVVVGPPKVGKTTLIHNLVKHFTKQPLATIKGPVTMVVGKKLRITLIECNNDINSMIDLAKIADLVLLLVDASFGFEMEIFEFLNICQIHGMPKILGILTHLDLLKNNKQLKKTKKTLKHRFWTEVYAGAKLFYLSGILHGEYLKNDIKNLGRFISVIKLRPLIWRSTHPYVLVDRMEDITDPEKIRQNHKCDRNLCLYGFARGIPLNKENNIHIPGCGDTKITNVSFLPDPCPLPEKKKRSLIEKERIIYAPFSGVGGVIYDKDAVYVELAGSHSFENTKTEGLELINSILTVQEGIDIKRQKSEIKIFSDSKPIIASEFKDSTKFTEKDVITKVEPEVEESSVKGDQDKDIDENEDEEVDEDEGEDQDQEEEEEEKEDDDEDEDKDENVDSDLGVDVEEKEKKRKDKGKKKKLKKDFRKKKRFVEQKVEENGRVRRKVLFYDEKEDKFKNKTFGKGGIDNDDDDDNGKDYIDDSDDHGDENDHQNQSKNFSESEKKKKDLKGQKLNEQKNNFIVEKIKNTLKTLENQKKFESESGLSELSDDENIEDINDDDHSEEINKKIIYKDENKNLSEEDNSNEGAANKIENHIKRKAFDLDDINEIPVKKANVEKTENIDYETSAVKWKQNLAQKAADAFLERQNNSQNLYKLVYGKSKKMLNANYDDVVENKENDTKQEIGEIFQIVGAKQKEKMAEKDALDEDDSSLFPCSAIRDWTSADVKVLIRDCFVTGKWKKSENAEELLKMDDGEDDAFGDFEDLETGEKHEVEKTDDEKNKLLEKKKKLKKKFDEEYDDKEEYSYYTDLKAQMDQQAQLNKSEFESLADDLRVQVEGFRPGMYIRVELSNMPCELVENFDPSYPLIIGGLLPVEENIGFVQVRLKKHRWYDRILKTKDPLIVSLGWRRFQTLVVYSKLEDNMRQRMLKYTPEHLSCMGHFYGPITPQGTGFLAVQDVVTRTSGFRIACTGAVVEVDKSVTITKKLKLVGTPLKIYKKTAFIQGMFNSILEVGKFEGAKIRTVSGIRGQIKKAISKPPGAFRGTFEDKIKMSDIVFCRTWYAVDVPKFYNPMTTLLLSPEMKSQWEGMKTLGQLKRERNIRNLPQSDSLYTPIVRRKKVFKPLQVPKALQKSLPYKDKPKNPAKNKKAGPQRIAVIKEPYEEKVCSLMKMIKTNFQRKKEEDRKTMIARVKQHRKEVKLEEMKRLKRQKELKKHVFRTLGLLEKDKRKRGNK